MLAPEAATNAYTEVERLVRKFKALSAPERRAYNEDNTRKDFILPLFRALEWNIDNAAEVSAEEKVSRGWVDFSFRLGGIPRFFLETKKIAEDLTRLEWVRQAVDYAWTKSVTWALLSDFEGLRVFNAEWKEENPLRAQFVEFSVDTYLSDFDRLWWLSRPDVAVGTLDREAEKVGKKAKKEPVSQHLFDDLKEWRHELFRHLRAYNKRYAPAQIDEAVLRILNRLIFIRAAEDRAVEPPRLQPLLRELADQGRSARLPEALAKLFRELDAVYDSDLFAEHFSEKLDCEPEPFRILIEGLHEKRGGYVRYNFNAIDADVLGTAYEQYLGHIVVEENARRGRASESASHVEEKRAKRKSQGIYYTPTFVVKYIVQQTLGRHLTEQGYNPARPVRVLDMACGSGSFLIEAFDVLDRHVAQLRGHATPLSPTGRGAGGEGRYDDMHDYARRMELLTQCIYGVDKDEQAVAVARLNLLLKALHERSKLPMLRNIRSGDSLISGAPEELRAAFGKDWKEKKAFNWEKEFPEVFPGPDLRGLGDPAGLSGGDGGFNVIVGNPPYVRIQTLPKGEVAFFNEHYNAATGNYDIYVLFVERALELLKPGGVMGFILPNKFFQADYGAGLRELLSKQKVIWQIVDFGDAQVFERASTYTCLLVLQKQSSAHLQYARVSQPATIISEPPTLQELDQDRLSSAPWTFASGQTSDLMKRLAAQYPSLGEVASKIFVGLQTSADTVFLFKGFGRSRSGKVRVQSKELEKNVELESALLKPVIRSGDIGRYHAEPSALVLFPYRLEEGEAVLLSQKELRDKFPLTWAYLQANRKLLEGREHGKFKGSGWYQLYPKNLHLWEQPKVMIPYMVTRLAAYPDESRNWYFVNVTTGGFGIVSQDKSLSLKYLTALLNSRLLDHLLKNTSTNFRGGYFAANKQYIERLPIRRINFSDPAEKRQHDEIVALVQEMLQLQRDYAEAEREKEDRRHALQRRIEAVDREIDRRVYALYGLTEEEIRVVEGVNG